ncbi:YlxR family protein [Ornithinimicrobium sp. W1665]
MGCRRQDEQSALLRVVAVHGPAGTDRWTVVPDERRRAHGRGAWVHPDPECVRIAIARRAFHRALRLSRAGTVDTTAVQERFAQQGRDTAGSTDPAASKGRAHPGLSSRNRKRV